MSVAVLAFAPGLALGSFLNVVAARVPLRRSLVHPASACMACGHEIAWRDNIPLLSYALLRGRCRSCAVGIPARYPAVELTAGLLFAASFWKFGLTGTAAVAAFFCLTLVAVSATDLEYRIIPNRIVVPAGLVVLAANTVLHPRPAWAIAAFGASGFLLATALAYPAGMGMGDVKLAFLMGAALGRTVPVALFIAMLAALVPGLYLIGRHGRGRWAFPSARSSLSAR
jgi:leader peptidase (prepilin peptidase) / N-methyltransferase